MKVLVLNGSPRSNDSNTMLLTKKFIEGLNSTNLNEIEFIDISKKNIGHCLGCYACWEKYPYKCVINDDMDAILKTFVKSDLIIWSFPLYHYGVPSKMKAFLDRTFPTELLYSNVRCGNYYGILPQDVKHIIISTCGNLDKDSYLSVDKMFSLSYGEENVEHIYLVRGEAINSVVENYEPLTKYLENVKTAGEQYFKFGKFSNRIKKALQESIFESEIFSVKARFQK